VERGGHGCPPLAGEADGPGAAGGLGNHVDVGLVFEDEARAAADHGVIVGQQDPVTLIVVIGWNIVVAALGGAG